MEKKAYSLCGTFNRLASALLDEKEFGAAFSRLDHLCAFISATDQAIEMPVDEALRRKVAELDRLCEIKSAQEILARDSDVRNFYPWALEDYYSAEYDFIVCHVPTFEKIAIIGHGAIPTLAMQFLSRVEENSVFAIDMYDSNAAASALAESIVTKFYPQHRHRLNFIVADIVNAAPARENYDLCIVSNAPLDVFLGRASPFPCNALFIRSSTLNGSLLYPRFNDALIDEMAYLTVERAADKKYKIHEWIVLKK